MDDDDDNRKKICLDSILSPSFFRLISYFFRPSLHLSPSLFWFFLLFVLFVPFVRPLLEETCSHPAQLMSIYPWHTVSVRLGSTHFSVVIDCVLYSLSLLDPSSSLVDWMWLHSLSLSLFLSILFFPLFFSSFLPPSSILLDSYLAVFSFIFLPSKMLLLSSLFDEKHVSFIQRHLCTLSLSCPSTFLSLSLFLFDFPLLHPLH